MYDDMEDPGAFNRGDGDNDLIFRNIRFSEGASGICCGWTKNTWTGERPERCMHNMTNSNRDDMERSEGPLPKDKYYWVMILSSSQNSPVGFSSSGGLSDVCLT